jgi:ABC-type sugar transport system ATPase subunit
VTPNGGTNGPARVDDVLRTEQISMSFGPVVALRSVDLHLQRGEVLGLVADNGAGKSTLVKILAGMYRPDDGASILRAWRLGSVLCSTHASAASRLCFRIWRWLTS